LARQNARKFFHEFWWYLIVEIIAQIVLQGIGFAYLYSTNAKLSSPETPIIVLIVLGIIGLIVATVVARRYTPASVMRNEIPKEYVLMYQSRDVGNMGELLKRVKHTYWSLAVTQQEASRALSPIIVKMIRKENKSFRFLLVNPNPNSQDGVKEPEFFKEAQGRTIHTGLDNDIPSILSRMKNDIFAELLKEGDVSKFEVKEYNLPITHTMIIVDAAEPDAFIRFESFTYAAWEGATPIFVIEKAKQPEVFENLLKSFTNAWDAKNTIPIDWNKL
jgi:hypothetical protein